MNNIIKAVRFAEEAHRGQVRKYNGRPYIEHPVRVMYKTMLHKDCIESMIIAALLHDTVEDCNVTFEQIYTLFGTSVTDIVRGLTNPSKGSTLSRAERKAWDRRHLETQERDVKIIKLIDRIDNLGEMDITDGFIYKYLNESEELAEVLRDGDETLYLELKDVIENLRFKLRKNQ